MANDPGLSADTCIYLEAVAGDGGAHSSSGVWWLSPDIQLTGATSGPDKADPGAANTVAVTVRAKPAGCTTPPGAESVTVEVWAGNPSLVMTPDNPSSAVKIDSLGLVAPGPGLTGSVQFTWTPPAGLPSDDPQAPGHKCLIARAYPDSLTPSDEQFFVPDDQHVAQRNICVVPCGGPGAARLPGPCGFDVTTANPSKQEAEATLRAVFDARPAGHVRNVVLGRLRQTDGFKRLAARPPRDFRLALPDFPGAKVSNQTRHGCLGLLTGGVKEPAYEARVRLSPRQFTRFTFLADLSGAQFGDAYVFPAQDSRTARIASKNCVSSNSRSGSATSGTRASSAPA
jgi:hypothetical protein